MGGTSSKQIGIEKKEKQSSFSRLSNNSDVGTHISYLDTALALHSNDLVLLNYNCDNFIPKIKYGIIIGVESPKSFTILCPIKDETINKFKLCRFVLYLNNIIVPKEDSIIESEKQAATKLIEILKDILYGSRVYIENVKMNVDGRLFCELKFGSDEQDLTEHLIYNNLGISYGNNVPNDWLDYVVEHHRNYKNIKLK